MYTCHEHGFDDIRRSAVVSDDPAHDADMRELRKEQLEADCGGDMADDIPFDDDWDYDA